MGITADLIAAGVITDNWCLYSSLCDYCLVTELQFALLTIARLAVISIIIIIIIIIIKRISRAPIYHTRWQHMAL